MSFGESSPAGTEQTGCSLSSMYKSKRIRPCCSRPSNSTPLLRSEGCDGRGPASADSERRRDCGRGRGRGRRRKRQHQLLPAVLPLQQQDVHTASRRPGRAAHSSAAGRCADAHRGHAVGRHGQAGEPQATLARRLSDVSQAQEALFRTQAQLLRVHAARDAVPVA